MHDSQPTSYLDRAHRLGQSVERLKAGEAVQTQVQVQSLEDLKELLAGSLTAEQLEQGGKDLSPERLTHHSDAPYAPLADFVSYIYGSRELSAGEKNFAQDLFPVTVTVVSKADMEVTTDITYGPSAAPVLLNVGKLTFNGGSLTARNTVLTLNADVLAFGSTTGKLPYHIGILGKDGEQGSQGAAGAAPSPAQATSGSNAKERSWGICTCVGDGGNGGNGAAGHSGKDGGMGKNGLPSLPATITIGALDDALPGSLVVFTRSGAGGRGGIGGAGGQGQQGGNGGNGCDSGCEGTGGGNAGSGGKGGKGGKGGQGGNAVNGFDTNLTVPVAMKNKVATSSEIAPFGEGGPGGGGGTGGEPGTKGKGGKGCSDGKPASKGDPGDNGDTGDKGTQQGAAGMIYVTYR